MKTTHDSPHGSGPVRLNKYLSMAGITSRRKADEMIQNGEVSVNGETVIDLGVKIDPAIDKVFVNGRQVAIVRDSVTILLNKPKDAITTVKDEKGRTTVMDYVRLNVRVYPVGRLDRNTTGVLLLTNDGELANALMHPRKMIKKIYKATLDQPLTHEHAQKLADGIRLADGKTSPAEVLIYPAGKRRVVGLVIHEGKNRQVHRMFEALGYGVEKLDRLAYADLTYDGVPRGRWRFLTVAEVRRLASMVSGPGE
jgi:23S rRNA pseudouridine2605 synthase